MAITHSRSEAEDAVHDAFVRLLKSHPRPHEDRVAYVFAAVRNAAIDRARAHRSNASGVIDLEPCLAREDGLESAERQHAIAAALRALDDDQRNTVLLRIYGGLTFRQIGEVLQSPLQTVVSRYHAALESLRPQLRIWT